MKIGIVDLDTSHPQNWIPIERELGDEVVGVWDGGSVHPAFYVRDFAKRHGIPVVYDSLARMAPEVDCAVIHGCDWDTHVSKARPFVERGKAVLIDKPLAGNLADLRQLEHWARAGARLAGGSALRFCGEVTRFLARPIDERGTVHTALAGCAVDEFNYGIHAYAMLCGILGPGAESVRHLGGEGQRRILVQWPDGRMGFVLIGAARQWLPFYATVVTDTQVVQVTADVDALYRALLTSVRPYLAGECATPPVPVETWDEPERLALAARRSWQEGDRVVRLDELREADGGYDGAAFATGYRRSKYPDGAPTGGKEA